MKPTLKLHRDKFESGVYRSDVWGSYYAHFKFEISNWTATIRKASDASFSRDGEIIRYAGVWRTLREANEEARYILAGMV